jgi:hypothetical protein
LFELKDVTRRQPLSRLGEMWLFVIPSQICFMLRTPEEIAAKNGGSQMSYSASPGVAYPIAIGTTTGRAYRSVFENWRSVAGFAWLPLVLILGAQLIALTVGGRGFSGRILSSTTGIIGFLLFGTTFAVRWSRLLLLGERQGSGLHPPGWGSLMVVTAKICLVILAATAVVFGIVALAPLPLKIPIWVIGAIAIVALSPRFFLAFPSAAIERPLTLRAAWDALGGEYARFLACVLICYLPLAIIAGLAGRMAVAALSLTAWIGVEVVRLAVTFIDIAVLYAMLAEVYRGLSGPGVTGEAAD